MVKRLVFVILLFAGCVADPGQTGAGGQPPATAQNGGAAGAASFSPCPAAGTNCIVMPLGDSITDGYTVPGGYRIELFRLTLRNAQLIRFVGRKDNGPDRVTGDTTMMPFPRNHEGYNGYTIDNATGFTGISHLVDDAVTTFKPHIILLAIGTNDVINNVDLNNAPVRLGALLDKLTTRAPNAMIAVANIIPTRVDSANTRIQKYDAAIPALVQSRVAAGKHLLMVDMYAAFTANPGYKTALLADDLHPSVAGYQVMAQTWYAAIRSYIPPN